MDPVVRMTGSERKTPVSGVEYQKPVVHSGRADVFPAGNRLIQVNPSPRGSNEPQTLRVYGRTDIRCQMVHNRQGHCPEIDEVGLQAHKNPNG